MHIILEMDFNFKYVLLLCGGLCSVGLYGILQAVRKFKFRSEYNKLKILREARILQKKANLKKFEKQVNRKKLENVEEIMGKEIFSLLEYLRVNETNRQNVILAFQKSAVRVNKDLNCVVDFLDVNPSEINFKGPLAGLPVSVKDNFCVDGYYSCVGCSMFLKQPVNFNSVLVDVIKSLGGVPFAKTGVPQTLMSFFSSNPIDGIVCNPLDLSKSPGGSSSGEGALIGGHGSIVGLGTDIGGSVRLPAALCGIVGLKPTCNRLSKKGLLTLAKNSLVKGVCGILARDVDSMAFLFEHIVNSPLHRSLDLNVVPMDFNHLLYKSKEKLTIGYFVFDRSFHCVPAITRAVMETVDNLEKNGHKVVEWRPPLTGRRWLALFLKAIAADNGRELRALCQYDEIDFSIKSLIKVFNLNYIQYLYMMVRAYMSGNYEALIWLKVSQGLSTSAQVIETLEEIKDLRDTIFEDWNNLGIDVVICPSSGFASLPLKPSGSLTGMMSYLNLWNLIDFPAGTVPVSKVNGSDIQNLEKYPKDLSVWHANTFKAQTDSLGMSVSVQCVAKPWKEEVCLRVMKEIESFRS